VMMTAMTAVMTTNYVSQPVCSQTTICHLC
jgi:hypothetical protein